MGKRLLGAVGLVLVLGAMFGLSYLKSERRGHGGWQGVILFSVALVVAAVYYGLKSLRSKQRTSAETTAAARAQRAD